MTPNDSTDDDRNGGTEEFPFSARRLADLFPHCAVYVLDPDGRVAIWGQAAARLTGYAESEAVGTHYEQFFPESAREEADRLLEDAARTGRVDDEGWRRKRDGSVYRAREVVAEIRDDAGTLTGFAVVTHDATVEHERTEALRVETAIVESILDAQPDILYAFDREDSLLHWNDRLVDVTGYEPGELTEMGPLAFIAPEDRDRVAGAIERLFERRERVATTGTVLTKDGERIPYEFNSAPIVDETGTVLGFTGIGRDVSDRIERERELERLDRLNGVVRTINDELVSAETRRDLETAIVETFVTADAIEAAVVGTYDPEDGFDARVEADGGVPAADGLLPEPDAEPSVADPAARAAERETVAARRHLQDDPIDEWRAVAREYDYRAVAAVPFVAEERLAGVLGLYATVPDAFGEREREVLQEFGGTIGHAINAMEVRRLLYADAVVELEFESTDRGDVVIALSGEGECRISIDHLLPLTDDVFGYYLTASGIEPDRFRDLAADEAAVRELRQLDDEAEHRWEVEIDGATIAAFVTEYGARLRSQVVEDGVATVVIEASPDTEIRELVDALQSRYPETDFVAKRTIERPLDTRSGLDAALDVDMTEKQRTALEAAYYGGYFEWPSRSSDAGEIADRLGIARQTFHQHLRVAQSKLLDAYFDAE